MSASVCLASFIAVSIPQLRADDDDRPRTEELAEKPDSAPTAERGSKIRIQRSCMAYTPLGPERIQKTVYPGELFYCRVWITGLSKNADGESDLSGEVEFLNANGKSIAKESSSLKGSQRRDKPVRATLGIELPESLQPGPYTLRLTFSDLLASTSVELVETIEVKPIEFAIVNPRFFHDKSDVPAPCGGFEGQQLTIAFCVLGEDDSVDQHIFDVQVKLFDEDGNEESQSSGLVELESRLHPQIDMTLCQILPLPSPGKYTMQWTVSERSTGKIATHQLPVVVFDAFEKH